MRWDTMFVFCVMVGLSVLDGNQVQTMRKDITDLQSRVEKLEHSPHSSLTVRQLRPGDPGFGLKPGERLLNH